MYKARRVASEPWEKRARKPLTLIAVGACGLAMIGGVSAGSPGTSVVAAPAPAPVTASSAVPQSEDLVDSEISEREKRASRSRPIAPQADPTPSQSQKSTASSESAPLAAVKLALAPTLETESRWATARLNLRVKPTSSAGVLDEVKKGSELKITGETSNGFSEVVWGSRRAWVTSRYLDQTKPGDAESSEGRTGGKSASKRESASSSSKEAESSKDSGKSSGDPKISSGLGPACSKGSSIESGITTDAVKAYRYMCKRWPQIKTYGGYRPQGSGFHPKGRAIDVMIYDTSLGWEVANFMRANASQFGITQVIYYRKVWTTQRSKEGWRPMSDRGGITANHEDHVHLSFR